MRYTRLFYIPLAVSLLLASCKSENKTSVTEKTPLELDMEASETEGFTPEKDADGFAWQTDKFADLKTLRYKVPGWEKLSEQQQKLVYYLNQAGLSGRDIMYDQNYRHNLTIRNAMEKIYTSYDGDKSTKGWSAFETYLKRIWFSNGIHHHYSNAKMDPGFSREYFDILAEKVGVSLEAEPLKAIFDSSFENKKVNKDTSKGLLKGSAVNFYAPDVTARDVQQFYEARIDKTDSTPIEHGLNSKLVKNAQGELEERVWKVGGMYSPAIEKIVSWLEQAVTVAENPQQGKALELLIEYYRTGDLATWDEYNIAWVGSTAGDIDYINGFIEVYNDPIAFRGSYETVIEITDFDASARMKVLADRVQWFEDNAPLMEAHKKKNVMGVTYKVVTVAGEAGDSSPSTPIGVNLPNNNWIRQNHGSKSVSLGNIVNAYSKSGGSGILQEFAHDEEEIRMEKEHGELADKLHTALHEVVGHASGQIEPGVGQPKETLGEHMSTLEEGRADLVALYYLYDQKLIDMGLMKSLDVGKAAYDGYIRNGLMTQLRRLSKVGDVIEEDHMRNRQWVSSWVYEQGKADNIIEKVERDGKTYYNITDYEKLRGLFGDLLQEVQRIKSQGDTDAGSRLVLNHGVKVDPVAHQQVLDRTSKLDIAPYGGFINPIIAMNGDVVTISYPTDFVQQHLTYSKTYGFLPEKN